MSYWIPGLVLGVPAFLLAELMAALGLSSARLALDQHCAGAAREGRPCIRSEMAVRVMAVGIILASTAALLVRFDLSWQMGLCVLAANLLITIAVYALLGQVRIVVGFWTTLFVAVPQVFVAAWIYFSHDLSWWMRLALAVAVVVLSQFVTNRVPDADMV